MRTDAGGDRGVRVATLGLAALATGAAGLAIAEPGRSPGHSLAEAAVFLAVAWAASLRLGSPPTARPAAGGDRAGRRAPASPPLVVGLLAATALPFAVEAARLAWSGRSEPLEVVLIAALRNLGLGLAALAGRPAFARLAALVSLFLVLVSSSVAEGPAALGALGAYAVAGGAWLALAHWKGLRLPSDPAGPRRSPVAAPALALLLVGLVVAVAAVGPTRAATALAGLMPSSGGTGWDHDDARGGVNDGANEVKGSEKPESIGFTDSDVYLESDRPSLYDAFSDMYGEPIKPKSRDRMVALSNQNIVEQKDRPAENLRAGRPFSAVRRGGGRPRRRPGDREADALLYVQGPTPLHLGLAAFEGFDGREWREAPGSGIDCPLVMEPGAAPWFRLDRPLPRLFAGSVAHRIKVGTLDSGPLPVPAHLARFRVGQVNRRDFFGWSHEGMMRMVGRTVPSGTVVEAEARTVDPRLLRATDLPPGRQAGDRPTTLAGGRPIAPGVAALARSWSGGVGRGWGQVEAVVAGLRRHASLDRGATAPADSDDVAADFLLRSRRGPDYLFATAAAVLLRSLDYPTRLVSGFYAAPARYDPRTRHTPVGREDVHVWAEVRLPNGTWVAVEPTPGYELMAPAIPWADRARAAAVAAWHWARSRPLPLALAAAALAAFARFRREAADGLATLAWRARSAADPRRSAVEALRLVDRRAGWAGRPRPPGRTPRRWYGPIASGSPGPGDDLDRLLRLAEWGLHAPAGAAPPPLRPGDGPRDACRRAVEGWTLRRFRASARPINLEGPET